MDQASRRWISVALTGVVAGGLALAVASAAGGAVGTVPERAAAAVTVKIEIAGDPDAAPGAPRERACSGALVGQYWVITASSCFTDADGGAAVAGVPRWATIATVGRADLTGTSGRVVKVDRLVPHPDRDVVLVHLAAPVSDVAPVGFAAAPPQVGDEITVTGYGRTADEVVPDTAHAARYTVGAVGGATLDITAGEAGVALCKGDAGGPALRAAAAGGIELVAIHHTAHQAGCLGATGTRQDATETRVDDLGPWIAQASKPVPGEKEFGVPWVASLYRDVLGRPGDASEHGYWAAKVTRGASLSDVATAIADSSEWRREFVAERYRTLLAREPDAGGMNVYTGWFSKGKDTFAITFDMLCSPEYYSRVGGNDAALIRAVHRDVLGREASTSEVNTGVSLIRTNGRPKAVYDIVYSPAHVNRVVDLRYRQMLGRPATTAEVTSSANALWRGGTVQQLLTRLAASDDYLASRVRFPSLG